MAGVRVTSQCGGADLSLASSDRLGTRFAAVRIRHAGAFTCETADLQSDRICSLTGSACSDRLRRNVCASAGGVLFP